MDESILDSIKQALGLDKDYHPFDFEILMHINSVIATLTQLGVGPSSGLVIDKDTTWSALLLSDSHLNASMSYIFLRVKMIFDPPNTQALVSSYEKRIEEEEWRLVVAAEPYIPQLIPGVIDEDPIILDGGSF